MVIVHKTQTNKVSNVRNSKHHNNVNKTKICVHSGIKKKQKNKLFTCGLLNFCLYVFFQNQWLNYFELKHNLRLNSLTNETSHGTYDTANYENENACILSKCLINYMIFSKNRQTFNSK